MISDTTMITGRNGDLKQKNGRPAPEDPVALTVVPFPLGTQGRRRFCSSWSGHWAKICWAGQEQCFTPQNLDDP